MSQEQPQRPHANPAVKYGDVFNVSGQLAPAAELFAHPIPADQQEGQRWGQGQQRPEVHGDQITIGEALEVTAVAAGDEPVTLGDAAAIQAAEVRATGRYEVPVGGLSSIAQSAAALNEQLDNEEERVTLGGVLEDATLCLPADKVATREDAEGVASAETRNKPDLRANPQGVGAAVAAAALLNEGSQ